MTESEAKECAERMRAAIIDKDWAAARIEATALLAAGVHVEIRAGDPGAAPVEVETGYFQ